MDNNYLKMSLWLVENVGHSIFLTLVAVQMLAYQADRAS